MSNANPLPVEFLTGHTYRLKPPQADHNYYVTINDKPEACGQPAEIFINSKSMEHYQWVVGMTRLISLMLRSGIAPAAIAEELRSVHDPHGGYWRPGRYMPSFVAEIGYILDAHVAAASAQETA